MLLFPCFKKLRKFLKLFIWKFPYLIQVKIRLKCLCNAGGWTACYYTHEIDFSETSCKMQKDCQTWTFFSISFKINVKKQTCHMYPRDFFPGQVLMMNVNNIEKLETSSTFPSPWIADSINPKTPEMPHKTAFRIQTAKFPTSSQQLLSANSDEATFLRITGTNVHAFFGCPSYVWSIIFQCPTSETQGTAMECLHWNNAGLLYRIP